MRRTRSCRGSVMVEFSLAGIASITLLLTTIQLCIGLWNYHTLAYSVHEATRYVSSHGRGCVTGTTSCAVSVSDIVAKLASDSLGMSKDTLNATLTTDSGDVTTCSPLTACATNTTRWPPTSNLDNATGKHVTITVSHTFTHAMLLYWPGSFTQHFNSFVLPASSTETIVF